MVELSTTPNNKQAAVNKGFALGEHVGTLNAGFEHTKSVSDPASPHTSYDRNGFSLRYAHTLNKTTEMPLSVEAGFTGNIGGYDSKADPDIFINTYEKIKSNNLRGNFSLRWLLNKSWITNLTLSGSVNYSNKLSEINTNQSSSSSQPAIHTMEEGYFIATKYEDDPNASIILVAPGHWYRLYFHDDKPINYTAKLKADWSRKFGSISNKFMLGAEFNSSGNKGRGAYYDSIKYAPTWREYRYNEKPYMNNIALYAEEKLTLPLHNQRSKLEVMAGLRSDITMIKGSEYGTVQSLAPRFNAKFTFWENANKAIRDFHVYAGWGKAVKLPSFELLYPRPTYSDDLAFAPGTMADGSTFYAYYTTPAQTIYNPDLKWQYNEQMEVGGKINIKGVKITLSFFRNKTFNPYICTRNYTPYSYKLTDQRALENNPIPSIDRKYTIDRQTGIVTVTDQSGVYENQQLAYTVRNDYNSNNIYKNGSPIERRGLEWVIDLPRIPAIRTSFHLDGNYYYYKGTDETIIAWKPSSRMTDNTPFKYVGYYVGSSTNSTSSASSASISNGSISKTMNMNLMTETHIPKLRMIFTLKIEAALYDYTQRLSEYNGKNHGFATKNPENLFSDDADIYQGDAYVINYPLYYTTWDDPNTKIPFAEKFVWAKENDTGLYNELAKMVVKSNTNYYFNPNKISPYFSANINITKEIGKFASISFYANNFFNNMAKVKSSNNDTETTLYGSSYIPRFNYGLTLRLKL